MGAWESGATLGPYVLTSLIGAGGMGEVWKAHDRRLNRSVAIKRLHTAHGDRFEREARAIAALNHPNICQIHDIGPDYLVLEYVEGTPLTGPYTAEAATRLGADIAAALEEAHSYGILHRDLKPSNILVTNKGTAKLLDFGLATDAHASAVDCDGREGPAARSSPVDAMATRAATREGTVVGTPSYMSPEQAQGRPLDVRSEVFSFGAVLHEMLSGRRAFDGRTIDDILNAVIHLDPAPLTTAPRDVAAIVSRCLRKAPADRFASMADVRAALAAARAPHAIERQPSVAVLPFATLDESADQDYFGDGLAEEIINALIQLPGIKVIARTSTFAFRDRAADVRRIAGALGVDHVLQGSVRKSGTRIRVTAQLVAGSDAAHLWSQRYDRDLADVFAVQDEIAASITSSLRAQLQVAAPARTPRPDAHDALLKGRHQLAKATREAIGRAGEYLSAAVRLDPEYAAAPAALGSYYWMLASAGYTMPAREAMPLARAAALRAVELDRSSTDAHAMLCAIAAQFDYDWAEAERRFQFATNGSAVSPSARRMCGFNYLLSAGRTEDAAHHCELALQADPLNSFTAMQFAVCLHAAGRKQEAFDRYRQAVELDERNFLAHLNIALWLIEEGRPGDAESSADVACAIAPANPWAIACKAAARTLQGDTAAAGELLGRLGPADRYGAPAGRCRYYMLCGDLEAAAGWAEKAIEQRDAAFPFALQFSCARGLRESRYWNGLARLMNLV
jgi:TolB-like protein/Flp pilus assembly protein TadD